MTVNEQTYGADWAADYDVIFPDGPGVDATVDALAAYAAKSGAAEPVALELGVGTGRVAIPLAQRGVRVYGIDLEPTMLEVLRNKPAAAELADRLTVAVGDMTDVGTFRMPGWPGKYDLVYTVFTTISALPDGAAQKRCVRAASQVLGEKGRFVLEVAMPRLETFDSSGRRSQHVGRFGDRPALEVARLNLVEQVIESEIVVFSPDGRVRIQPLHHRFLWPAELDLMAEAAGLRRVSLSPGWKPGPFGPLANMYVAEYVVA
jgi:SAM-dependent methyltransferase